MRGPSHAGLWTLALAGSLVLHGAVAIALAAIPARQDKPPPQTRIAFETPPDAEAAGVSPAEIVVPAAAEAVAAVSPEAQPLVPAETASLPISPSDELSPAAPTSEAPVAAATEDVAALRPIEEETARASNEASSALSPVTDQAAAATNAQTNPLSPVGENETAAPVAEPAAPPAEADREVVEPVSVPEAVEAAAPAPAAVPAAEETAAAVALPEPPPAIVPIEAVDAATADSVKPAAEDQILSLPVAGGEIPAGAIVLPEAVNAAREEPSAVTASGPEAVAALAPEDPSSPAAEPPLAAAQSPPALQPLAPVAAPGAETPAAPAPVIVQPVAPTAVVEPAAQDAPPSIGAVEAVTATREPSLVIAGVSGETAAPTVLAPVEEETGTEGAAAPAPGGTQDPSETEGGTQLAIVLPRPDPQAPPPPPSPAQPVPMATFLKGYDSDECVLALPAGEGAVEAFADSPDKAEGLRAAYQRQAGKPLTVKPRQVSTGQCGALSFSRSLPQYPNYSLTIDLTSATIDSGEALSGRVEGKLRNTLYLLVVDDEGKARLAKTFPGVTKLEVPFSEPMVLTNGAAAPVQLLVAIGSDGPLKTAATRDGTLADAFFEDLAKEIVSDQRRISFGIAAFVVR